MKNTGFVLLVTILGVASAAPLARGADGGLGGLFRQLVTPAESPAGGAGAAGAPASGGDEAPRGNPLAADYEGPGLLDAPVAEADYQEIVVEDIANEYQANSVAAASRWEKSTRLVGGAKAWKPNHRIKVSAELSSYEDDTNMLYNRYADLGPISAGGRLMHLQQEARQRSITRPSYLVTVYLGRDRAKIAERFDRGAKLTIYGRYLRGGTGGIVIIPDSIRQTGAKAAAAVEPNLDLELKLSRKVTVKSVPKPPIAERAAINQALLQAAQGNDWDSVLEALAGGASPATVEASSGANVLALLSRQSDSLSAQRRYELSLALLEYGVDANGGYLNWPLVLAVERNEYDLALILVANGANPNEKVMIGRDTPMRRAERDGNVKMLELLRRAPNQ